MAELVLLRNVNKVHFIRLQCLVAFKFVGCMALSSLGEIFFEALALISPDPCGGDNG